MTSLSGQRIARIESYTLRSRYPAPSAAMRASAPRSKS